MTTHTHQSTARESLRHATEIRAARAAARRRIRALPAVEGREQVAGLLLNPPDWLWSMPVGMLLTWPRYTRHVKTEAIFEAAGVSPLARIAGVYPRGNSHQHAGVLTDRQRHMLADRLRNPR